MTTRKPQSSSGGSARAGASGTQKYFIVLATVLLVAIAGAVIYKVLRGDSDGAQSRAIAVSTPQGVAKLYENNPNMPPQARAAAEAAARAHGAPMGGTNR